MGGDFRIKMLKVMLVWKGNRGPGRERDPINKGEAGPGVGVS